MEGPGNSGGVRSAGVDRCVGRKCLMGFLYVSGVLILGCEECQLRSVSDWRKAGGMGRWEGGETVTQSVRESIRFVRTSRGACSLSELDEVKFLSANLRLDLMADSEPCATMQGHVTPLYPNSRPFSGTAGRICSKRKKEKGKLFASKMLLAHIRRQSSIK